MMTVSSISLLPYEKNIELKNIVDKCSLLKLLKKLLNIFNDALIAFSESKVCHFDAQVGETLCQIRAYKILVMKDTRVSDRSVSIRKTIEAVKGRINNLDTKITDFSDFLLLNKNNRPKCYTEIVTLERFMEDEGLVFYFSEDELFLFFSYFLCAFNVRDHDNIPNSIDYVRIRALLGTGRSFAKKIVHRYQKQLSILSVKFIYQLADDLYCPFSCKKLLNMLQNATDGNREVLPFYVVNEIIFSHLFKYSFPLTLIINLKNCGYEKNLIFTTQKSYPNRVVELLPGEHDPTDLSKETLVLYGENNGYLTHKVESSLELENRLNACGIFNIILANMAAHPQYAGKRLEMLKSNPFSYELQRIRNSPGLNAQYYKFLYGLNSRFNSMKSLANRLGCTYKNRALYFIKHIYCDTIFNQLEAYGNQMHVCAGNAGKLMLAYD